MVYSKSLANHSSWSDYRLSILVLCKNHSIDSNGFDKFLDKVYSLIKTRIDYIIHIHTE